MSGIIKQRFTSFKSKYIGDKDFYKLVFRISVPMMIQNGITNLVSLLDNIMVGRLGTEAMSGVSIVNQFIFIFNLLIFGSITSASIYMAQFYGSKNEDGLRFSFRFKCLITALAAVSGTLILGIFHNQFINMFLFDSENGGNLALTYELGKQYLFIMLVGLVPYGIAQVYASSLRETGEVVVPMLASVAAVVTNFVLNLVLIFGLLGFPALGVKGAALATVISRFVELLVLVVYAHLKTKRFEYLKGAFRSFKIPKALFKRIFVGGIPLMMNEFLWGMAMTMRNQCYSTRGLDVVAALNISTTVFNLFSVIYMALGCSIAIIVGNALGAGETEEAKDKDRKLIAISIASGVLLALAMVGASFFFPLLYKTTAEARHIASYMMIISGLTMPFAAFANAAYFTLRSGGNVVITLLFDSVFMWAIVMPLSICFAYLTGISIYILFPICQCADCLKSIFGTILLRSEKWVNVLVSDE